MPNGSLASLRLLLDLPFVAALLTVVALVSPLGYAMSGAVGLAWVTFGAVLWTMLFGYAAARRARSHAGWGLGGGLVCGTIWALGEKISTLLYAQNLGPWPTLLLFAVPAGLGAGTLFGAAFGRGASLTSERHLRLAAVLVAAALGASAGNVARMVSGSANPWLGLLFVSLGAFLGAGTAPPGRALGLQFRPVVLFFDQLWPYLRVMALPLTAFAAGYLCLTLGFAGFYGSLWRANPTGAFAGLPASPDFWDFVYFSLMTASTANTTVSAASGPAQVMVAAEVVLGMGWLIVVFGAMSVHLAPKLEAIAHSIHRTRDAEDDAAAEPPQTNG